MNYFEFLKLSSRRLKSRDDYLEFQKFQAKWIISDSLKGFNLQSKIVLDLGSGFGGYSQELAKSGADVYSVDLNISRQPQIQTNISLLNADCNNLPIRSESMDLVFCASLIEHVSDQRQLICEINRVLKKQGICYLSFPPFFSPTGGHQFKPFHLLGERLALVLSKYIYGLNIKSYNTSFGNWGLYPTTIQKVLGLIKGANFKIIDTKTKFSPINFAKVPLINEILTWHIEFILQKE